MREFLARSRLAFLVALAMLFLCVSACRKDEDPGPSGTGPKSGEITMPNSSSTQFYELLLGHSVPTLGALVIDSAGTIWQVDAENPYLCRNILTQVLDTVPGRKKLVFDRQGRRMTQEAYNAALFNSGKGGFVLFPTDRSRYPAVRSVTSVADLTSHQYVLEVRGGPDGIGWGLKVVTTTTTGFVLTNQPSTMTYRTQPDGSVLSSDGSEQFTFQNGFMTVGVRKVYWLVLR